MHIHVFQGEFEAKFWLEPSIELAHNYGLRSTQISKARRLIEEHQDEFKARWRQHFGG